MTGVGIWQDNFRDILIDRQAECGDQCLCRPQESSAGVGPEGGEKLIPKQHGLGTHGVPLETDYNEIYKQDNVEMVDLQETPIERITPRGITTSAAAYTFDLIIFAAGFDTVSGSFDCIDLRGVDGWRLKDKWQHGPQTALDVLVDGFPDMRLLIGLHMVLGNIPRSIKYHVDWVTGLVRYAWDHHRRRAEATPTAVEAWTDHVKPWAWVCCPRLLDDGHQQHCGKVADLPH